MNRHGIFDAPDDAAATMALAQRAGADEGFVSDEEVYALGCQPGEEGWEGPVIRSVGLDPKQYLLVRAAVELCGYRIVKRWSAP